MSFAEVEVRDIKRMALRGGLAKLLGQGGNLALRVGFLIVAARLLTPEDFGLLAMVMVITAVLNLFATAGLSSAMVQKATVSHEEVSALFWINIFVGVALSLVCVLIAPLVVTFYREPRLFWVTVTMGLGFFFNAVGVQPLALLQRQMRYVTLSAIEFLCQLTSFGIGIALAFAGYGYWSLVIAAVMLPAIMTVSAWMVTAWIPDRPSWPAGVRSMLHFGGTVTLNALISYMTYSFDRFVLGRVWGASAVGYYGVASQLINTPTQNLNTAVGGVIFSALSRLQNDSVRLRNYFLKGYSLNISITAPIAIFAAVFAPDIILVVLGPKWTDSIVIFQFLAPSVLVFGIINPFGWLLWALGRHVRSLTISLVIAVLVITGCVVGLPYGPKGVAAGFSAAMVLWLIPHIVWCLHGTTITPLDLLRASSPPFFSAILAVALSDFILAYSDSFATPLTRLVLACGVMIVAYSGLMILVMGKDFYLDLFRAMRNTSSSSSEAKEVEQAGYLSLTPQ